MNPHEEVRQHALRYLSRQPHGRSQLARKLSRRHPRETIEAVMDELEQLGLLDDAQLARDRARFARDSRKWGDLRIRADLQRLGISAKIVHSVLVELSRESPELPALEAVIASWTAKHGRPATLTETKKLFDHCVRRGYRGGQVREAIEKSGNWEVTGGS